MKLLLARGAVAKSHQEDVADRGAAVTELQGLAADAKMLLAWLPM